VASNSAQLAAALDDIDALPVRVVHQPVLTDADGIRRQILAANSSDRCIGVIAWMHTFSPAKMWIAGLVALQKPLLHLHSQFHRELPWSEIDMDYMNLHQSAHGDREFAHLLTRMRVRRKTVAGHVDDPGVGERIGTWARAAAGWHEAHSLRVVRFGDNMRDVAVTDGDKVEAQVLLADRAVTVPGMCGAVEDGVVPGLWGYEAGQSGVGDIFAWFTEIAKTPHDVLEADAAKLRPGESGLLALDWWNGNRSVLVNADLSGLLLGMTLATGPAEVYRALIEATAFGTRLIVEAFEASGVAVDSIIACGGLPERNTLLLQVYADVLRRRSPWLPRRRRPRSGRRCSLQ
jgi:L-arabinose isomerase/FGGY family of carbohydrate kinases, C-terminal domain